MLFRSAWDSVKSWFSGAVGKLTGTARVNVATDGSHAGGLDYVPFDGYIAELHKGERILTAQEAREYSGGGRVVNLNIQTNELTPAMVDYVIRRANEEGITVKELGDRFIKEYYTDADALGVKRATVNPRATEHIQDIIDLEIGRAHV